ncbi:MAG: DUF1573 domain-containing protein [Phycisphaera sp. RhM]|nr:DUF1573 domain-containing protein [Phycisphaera sp. RhM]
MGQLNRSNRDWDRIGFLLVSLGLLLSAGLKVYALTSDDFADLHFQLPISLLWISVVFEIAFATFLYSSASTAAKHLSCTVLFSIVAVISFIRWSQGHVNCGCFGMVTIHPAIAGVICVAIAVIALVRLSLCDGTTQALSELSEIWSLHQAPIWFTVCLACVTWLVTEKRIEVWGDRLLNGPKPILAHVEAIDEIPVDTEVFVDFQLHNRSANDVEVVGVTSSCSCMGTRRFAGFIRPNESRKFEARLVSRTPGPFHERLMIYTDSRRQPVVAVDFFSVAMEK